MRHRKSIAQGKQRLISEYILYLHTVMVYLLSSSASLVWYLNYFSILSAGIIFFELLIVKRWRPEREFYWIFAPLVLLAVMSFAAAILDPATIRYSFMIVYAYVLGIMYYFVVSATGRIWFFTAGIFTALMYIFISQGLEAVPLALEAEIRGQIVLGADETGDSLNMNTYALICLFCLAFASYQAIEAPRVVKHRLHCFLYIVICILVAIISVQQIIIVSGSRKGMVLICFLLILIAFLGSRGRITIERLFISSMFAALFLIIGIFVLKFSPFYWRLEEMFEGLGGNYTNEMSYIVRMEFAKAGFDIWKQNPVFGDFCEFRRLFGTYTHSTPIDLLANHGIIGFLLYYSYYLIYLKVFFIKCFKSRNPVIVTHAIFIGSFFLMFFVWGLGAVDYFSRYSFPVVGVLLGMSGYDLKILKKLENKPRVRSV